MGFGVRGTQYLDTPTEGVVEALVDLANASTAMHGADNREQGKGNCHHDPRVPASVKP